MRGPARTAATRDDRACGEEEDLPHRLGVSARIDACGPLPLSPPATVIRLPVSATAASESGPGSSPTGRTAPVAGSIARIDWVWAPSSCRRPPTTTTRPSMYTAEA